MDSGYCARQHCSRQIKLFVPNFQSTLKLHHLVPSVFFQELCFDHQSRRRFLKNLNSMG